MIRNKVWCINNLQFSHLAEEVCLMNKLQCRMVVLTRDLSFFFAFSVKRTQHFKSPKVSDVGLCCRLWMHCFKLLFSSLFNLHPSRLKTISTFLWAEMSQGGRGMQPIIIRVSTSDFLFLALCLLMKKWRSYSVMYPLICSLIIIVICLAVIVYLGQYNSWSGAPWPLTSDHTEKRGVGNRVMK